MSKYILFLFFVLFRINQLYQNVMTFHIEFITGNIKHILRDLLKKIPKTVIPRNPHINIPSNQFPLRYQIS